MSHYVAMNDAEKLVLLRGRSFQAPWPSLDHTNWCLQCEREFTGHSVRVWQDRHGTLGLECGTPGCDGSPIDWSPYPWWDETHPETHKHLQAGDDPSICPV